MVTYGKVVGEGVVMYGEIKAIGSQPNGRGPSICVECETMVMKVHGARVWTGSRHHGV